MARPLEHKEYRVAVGAEPADRPIAPLRTDLLTSPQLFYGQLCFVVKDPVTLRYFRLQPVEHFLVTQFDGRRTARDLLGLLQQQYPEGTLSVQDVLRFVGMLHESHLLVGAGLGHAEWLTKRRAAAKLRLTLLELLQNFLFFKLPIFHPDRLLTLLDKTIGRVIFRTATGFAALGLILLALWNVLMHTDLPLRAALPYNLLSWQKSLRALLRLHLHESVSRVRPRPGGKTLRRRSLQHGRDALHRHAQLLLRHQRRVDADPLPCAPRASGSTPRRNRRRTGPRGASATFIWLNTPDDGPAQSDRPQRDDLLQRRHALLF